jgi:glycosyltransferase involved in cell wall biosynthesis
MKLLYITYIDTQDTHGSGSSVRALKMLEAFTACGCEIMLLDGWNRKNLIAKRDARVKAMLERLETEVPDACYVEVPAGPLFCWRDIVLLKKIKERGIPLSIFYGDAYWRFPAFSGIGNKRKRRTLPKWFKDIVIYWMQRYDWSVYRNVSTRLYFPSASMAAHFDFPSKRVSFPGTNLLSDEHNAAPDDGAPFTGIYVGGASVRYGTPLLLEAFKRVNAKGIPVRLILVCPEEHWQALPAGIRTFESSPWLDRQVAAGDAALMPLYKQAHFACLPLRRNIYNDFAMSIKLFEYLSYHKPILSTSCKEMASFIEQNGVGLVSEDAADAYAKALEYLVTEHRLGEDMRTEVKTVCAQNTWVVRAQEIIEDFQDAQ